MATKKETKTADLTIEMSVMDRIHLQQITPKQNGSMIDHMNANNILKKIEFGSEEAARLELRNEKEGEAVITKWKQSEDKPTKVQFTNLEAEYLREQIKELDEKKSIPFVMFNLIQKIV